MAKLTEPLHGGKLQLHNRLVMPPMVTAKADPDGHVTDSILQYYDEKSRGGNIGLVITEHCFVNPQGRASSRQLSVADDSTIDDWRRLADVLHKNGVKAAMQINHAGSAAVNGGLEIVGPSGLAYPDGQTVPVEVTQTQIDEIIEDFQLAAGRAKTAGFDAVEIHSAHGYLLNQFYSPLANFRQDEYGGGLDNRIRIHRQVIQAVRAAVGKDFAVLLRFGGCDYIKGGSTIEDSVAAALEFEKAGVDILDISGGFCRYTNPNSSQPGYFSDMSSAVKQKVSIPVILTGGITSAEQADKLLESGAADLIGVGRAIYNDSDWAANAMQTLVG